jgi:hypothetical protein
MAKTVEEFQKDSKDVLNKALKSFRKELKENLTYHKAIPFVTRYGHHEKAIKGNSNDKI